MSITEALAMKAALEEKLRREVMAFCEKTGLLVDSIDVEKICTVSRDGSGGTSIARIKVVVEL